MKDKKGQNLTLGTIIIILLGLVVLVILIFGFTTGWNNLFEKLKIFGGTESNVGDIAQVCQLACSAEQTYDYCQKLRTVNYGDKILEKGSCESLEDSSKIGVDDCSIVCDPSKVPDLTTNEESATCESLGGEWTPTLHCAVEDLTFQVLDSKDKEDNPGQACCKQ